MSAVIHVITALERGGAQRNTLETCARLHHPRRPQLLVAGVGGALGDEARARLGTRFVSLPSLRNPVSPVDDARALGDLRRLFAREAERLRHPVVVHTHSSKAGILGRLAASAVGLPTVHTIHGFGVDALGPRLRPVLLAAERIVDPLTDVAVFVSEADVAFADAHGLFTRAERRVIRSGVHADAFSALRTVEARVPYRAALRARLGIDDDAPVAVTIGNLKPQKDPLFHVDVLAAWRALDPRAQLVFAGDGPLRDEVVARARAAGVADALHLVGFVDDVRPLLGATDVFLLASAWEGLPRSVLEATATGLPCVVRDTGWASDVAFARSVTALPPTSSPAEFARALAGSHRATPRRLPRAFTLEGMLDDLRALYDRLCGPIIEEAELNRLRRRRRRQR
ncbi:MAG: glycosyltransferase family 4 protein [Deltaproteobacteria bacterium]|nr:glycosyltransferase family 4 protein [Deltaproteobacteria bacterium]